MLYNKAWEKPEIKADPFSLESLIAWLEKQPAAGQYDYMCIGECMVAQYFAAMGFSRVSVGSMTCVLDGNAIRLPADFNDIAHDVIGRFRPFYREARLTFGAALSRARKALAERGA